MIDVTLLGTSALLPLPDRPLTAAFLSCQGNSILFDCGEGTQAAARAAGVSLMKTGLIALTHYHGDHILGLPGLLQTMHCMGRKQPLCIVGPKGIREALAPVLALAGQTGFPVWLSEPGQEEEKGLRSCLLPAGWPAEARLWAFPTEHRVVSQGYCFTLGRAGKFLPEKALALGVAKENWSILQKGRSVQSAGGTVFPWQVLGPPRKGLKLVFSGDTVACPSLVEASRGADLAIYEATFATGAEEEYARECGHMTFAQAAGCAAGAGVKKLWLAHFSQRITDPEEYLPEAVAVFENTVCGTAGLSETLRFEE